MVFDMSNQKLDKVCEHVQKCAYDWPGNIRQLRHVGKRILLAMQNSGWSIRGAALPLGISRQSPYTLLEAHSQIRRPEQIPMPEITDELAKANGDVDACAAELKTPAEALRRYLRLRQCI